MRKTCYIIAFTLLLIPVFLWAQTDEQKKAANEQFQDIIEEMIRVPDSLLYNPDLLNKYQKQESIKASSLSYRSDTIGEEKVVFTSYPESEVHSAINPKDSNNMVLCPIQYTTSTFNLPVYFTKDFGQSWVYNSYNAKPNVPNKGIYAGGDPVFAFDANGKLYLSWIDVFYDSANTNKVWWAMYWAYSDDGGENWLRTSNNHIEIDSGSPPNYQNQLGNFNAIYDKEWIAVDRSNSAYSNTLYACLSKYDMVKQYWNIVLKKKSPSNDYFDSNEIIISDNSFEAVQFTNIDVDMNGYVHVIFFGSKDLSTYSIYHTISTDGGKSFSTPAVVSNLIKMTHINGISDARIYPSDMVFIDKSNSVYKGNIYVTFTSTGINSVNGNASEIFFCRSTDGGQSWSTPIVVNDDNKSTATEQFYSSISVNSLGDIVITWYDGRNSTGTNNVVRYYVAYSFDGGQTFTKNFPVSLPTTDFNTVGLMNNSFGIGEYNQVLTSNKYALAIWSDGRLNNGNLDIYFARIPFDYQPSGIPEISSITQKTKILMLYPDPTNTSITLKYNIFNHSNIYLSILNLNGAKIKSFSPLTKDQGIYNSDLDISDLPAGKYVLLFETDSGYQTKMFTVIH